MDAGPIKNFSDLVFTVDMDGIILGASESSDRILGYPSEKLFGLSFLDLLSIESAGAVRDALRGAVAEPSSMQFVHYRALSEGGSWLPFEAIIRNCGIEGSRSCLRVDSHDLAGQANSERGQSLQDRALIATSNSFIICDATQPGMPIVYANPAFERISGYTAAEVMGKSCRFLQGRDTAQPGIAELRKAFHEKLSCRVTLRNYHKDGKLFWNDLSVSPIFDSQGNLTHYLGVLSEITRQKLLEEKLFHGAFHDALTDLPNRLLFMQKLEQAGRNLSRTPSRTFAVILLDLAKFRTVNTTLGLAAGDKLLRHVADSLVRCMRDTDTVARLGSDEFVILSEDIHGAEEAMQVGERILMALTQPVTIEEHELRCVASVGIALCGGNSLRPQDCLNNAGKARSRARLAGGSQCVLFDDAPADDPENQIQLANEIRRGIESGEFLPYYQPIVDLGSGHTSRFEALVRWNHPTRGLLVPAAFLALAEETDLILKLGHAVLHQVCRDINECLLSFAHPSEFSINFNLSGREFSQPNLVDSIREILGLHHIPPSCLHVELTEGVVIESPDVARLKLRKLRDFGIRIDIDDFGTGHSSLARLQHFPLDCLKIDRSFVESIEKDRTSAEIVRSIIAMAHALGLTVVAEGVETEGQAEILREFGCEFGQGYHFARPMPAGSVFKMLDQEALNQVRVQSARERTE